MLKWILIILGGLFVWTLLKQQSTSGTGILGGGSTQSGITGFVNSLTGFTNSLKGLLGSGTSANTSTQQSSFNPLGPINSF